MTFGCKILYWHDDWHEVTIHAPSPRGYGYQIVDFIRLNYWQDWVIIFFIDGKESCRLYHPNHVGPSPNTLSPPDYASQVVRARYDKNFHSRVLIAADNEKNLEIVARKFGVSVGRIKMIIAQHGSRC